MTQKKYRDDMVTTGHLSALPKDQGLVIDLAEAAEKLPAGTGENYVKSTDWRLTGTFTAYAGDKTPAEVRKQRSIDAETHVLGRFKAEPQEDLPDFGASGMVVKRRGDMHLAMPEIFDFALSRVNVAANDALKLYGPDLFKDTEMLLIVQRTDIDPQEAHRQHFAGWHDHLAGGQNLDMIYSFSNVMGTESKLYAHKGEKIEPLELTTPDARIMRIGGETMHRSQRNVSEEEVRREWGALTVNIDPADNRRRNVQFSENTTMVKRDDPRFEQFKARAAQILGDDFSVEAYETPRTLVEELDTDVEYIP